MAIEDDDRRLGFLLKAIRRRAPMTQEVLAGAAAVPVRDVIAIEGGFAGRVKLERVRRVFVALGGGARLTTWWRGAEGDRVLDERHAALVDAAIAILRRRNWEIAAEATFSEFGERGSIDILGAYRPTLAVAVCEVKGSLGSLEATNRLLDVKVRLAPKLAMDRFGWQPRIVGRLLILPEDRTIRRLVERHAETMGTVYPSRGREVREWLHYPDRPLRAIWFLSEVRLSQTNQG